MKRTLIRMLGCIMSAVGLGMTYDSTIQILTDDTPGTAFAAADTSGVIGSGMDSYYVTCTTSARTKYTVDLIYEKPWYVGWLSPFASADKIADWKVYTTATEERYQPGIEWTGENYLYSVTQGNYGVVTSRHADSDFASACLTTRWFTGGGLGGDNDLACVSGQGLVYESCLITPANSYHSGFIYASSTGIFSSYLGCCEASTYSPVPDSSGSGSASVSGSGSNCECYYTEAQTCISGDCISGGEFVSPGSFRGLAFGYDFASCGVGSYQTAEESVVTINGHTYNAIAYPMIGMINGSSAGFLAFNEGDQYTICNDYTSSCHHGVRGGGTFHFCSLCPAMSSITNYTDVISFSATDASSDSGVGNTTCNKTVTNAKDVSGTFDFVGTCSYNE